MCTCTCEQKTPSCLSFTIGESHILFFLSAVSGHGHDHDLRRLHKLRLHKGRLLVLHREEQVDRDAQHDHETLLVNVRNGESLWLYRAALNMLFRIEAGHRTLFLGFCWWYE